MIKIGYQGIEGSNNEEVSLMYIRDNNIEAELVPLVNSQNVVNALLNDEIDVGVMATFNIIGGEVIETKEALKGITLNKIAEYKIPIHHVLFKKKNVEDEYITVIASHEQALKQTKNNRAKYYPELSELKVEDTAIAARYLSEGKLKDNVAVLCRKNAGEMFGLEIMYENLEDNKDNYTEFGVYTK